MEDGSIRVKIIGSLDRHHVQAITPVLVDAAEERAALIVDLEDIDALDVAGSKMLRGFADMACVPDADLRMTRPPQRIALWLTLSGLHDHLPLE